MPAVVIFAFTVLLLVLSFVCVNTLVLSRIIGELEEKTETTKLEASEFTELYGEFLRMRTYLSITVNHDDIKAVEEEFAEILGALNIDDHETAAIAKSRLVGALSHLRRLSGFNIDSVI